MLQQTEIGRIVVPISMKEAINEYVDWRKMKMRNKTCSANDRELRNLCMFLRNPEIGRITFNDIMDYLKGLLEIKELQQNSLLSRSMAIRKFFEFTRRRGLTSLDEMLIPVPRQEYTIPRVIDDDTYSKLIAAIPGTKHDSRHVRNMALIGMLWDTGARNGEICSLDILDVDTVNKKALIRTEKNRGSRPFREIFWTDGTNAHVINWIKTRAMLSKRPHFQNTDAFFISIAGHTPGGRFTVHGVSEMLRIYSNLAKLPRVNAHSMRHHKAHDIANKTGSAIDVMNILGHASLKSSSRYVEMRDKALENRARMIMAS